ncbi:putative nuclease HARBI1 [Dissostichus eleginoides]|uniref:Nuclease HARBI1 n=1 Tax=Dissostichus eleginoides TaxID=100907 RepID=A0AAD9CHZ5_DISEL|nr:putative nuclease HARBI1 [Dissostichus eleginoides]
MAGIVHIFHAGRRGYRQRVRTERPKPLQQPQLQCRTLRSHALTVEEQVLIALRFYACVTFYQVIADGMGVHKTTVGEVVTAVSDALARLLDHFVTFPNDGQIAKVKQKFFLLGDIPNTIGVIDCTRWSGNMSTGKGGTASMCNLWEMLTLLTNCVVRWPGSVHDADNAYPLLPWVKTPFPTANTPSQMRYNNANGRTRCAIERLNGVLKRRFACLNYLRSPPL